MANELSTISKNQPRDYNHHGYDFQILQGQKHSQESDVNVTMN